MYTYGHKLKEIRKYLRYSQSEMAHKLCLSLRTYTSYERDENKPPLNVLDRLHLNFDVNLNWFISEHGGMILPKKSNHSVPPSLKEEIKKAVLEMVKAGEISANDI